MASFLQQQPISFEKYTPQWDVALYGKIGAQKQAQYVEGVRQSQEYIDKIAGMSVFRDVDKQYVKSKVDAAVSKANALGAEDFSDQRITGRIKSYAGEVASDENIQSALQATQRVKEEMELAKKARKEGKGNIMNEAYLQKDIQQYMNNPEVGASFNGSYVPYVDVRKKINDVIKGVVGDDITADEAFQTNPDGSYVLDANGQKVLSDAVVRKQISGLTADRLEGIISRSLDPNDAKQLAIEGWYSYSGKSPGELSGIISKEHTETIQLLESAKKIRQDQLSGIKDPDQKKLLESEIESIDKNIANVQSNNESYQKMISEGNTEGASANFYTTNFIRSYSKDFSYKKISTTLETSPLVSVALDRERIAMQERHHAMDYEQAERKIKQDKDIATGAIGGMTTTIPQDQLPDATISAHAEKITDLQNQIKVGDNQFLTDVGHPGDNNWLLTQQAQFEKDENSVEPRIRYYLSGRRQLQSQLMTNQQLITQIETDADSKFGSNVKPVTFTFGGKTYTATPSEIMDMVEAPRNTWFVREPTVLPNNKLGQMLTEAANDPRHPNSAEALKAMAAITDEVDKTMGVDKLIARKKYVSDEVKRRTGAGQGMIYHIPAGKTELEDAARSAIHRRMGDKEVVPDGKGGETKSSDIKEVTAESNATYAITVVPGTQFTDPKYMLTVTGKEKQVTMEISAEDKRFAFGSAYEDATSDSFTDIRSKLTATGNRTTNFAGVGNVNSGINPGLPRNNFSSIKTFNVTGDVYEQGGGYGLALYVADPKTGVRKYIDFMPNSGPMDQSSLLKAISLIDDNFISTHYYGKPFDANMKTTVEAQYKTIH